MITQEEWNSVTAEPIDLTEMDEKVRRSVVAWEKYDELHKIASEAREAAEKLDVDIIMALKACGKSKYFVDGVGTMTLCPRAVVRVPSSIESKKKFFKFLRDIGEDVLYSMLTVNSNTLNSWYGQKLEEASSKGILGFSVPGIDDPTTRESLRFTKDRKANGKS